MSKTIACQIREFLGTQPEDCHKVNLGILAHALQVAGPVVWRGQVVSSTAKGDEHSVDFDLRGAREFAMVATEAGKPPTFDLSKIPPDAELAKAWGLPLAAEIPLPPPDAPMPAPIPPEPPNAEPSTPQRDA